MGAIKCYLRWRRCARIWMSLIFTIVLQWYVKARSLFWLGLEFVSVYGYGSGAFGVQNSKKVKPREDKIGNN